MSVGELKQPKVSWFVYVEQSLNTDFWQSFALSKVDTYHAGVKMPKYTARMSSAVICFTVPKTVTHRFYE